MSFQPVRMRHTTVVQLQFQPLSPHGLLFYVAQHLSASAGEDAQIWFCTSQLIRVVLLEFHYYYFFFFFFLEDFADRRNFLAQSI